MERTLGLSFVRLFFVAPPVSALAAVTPPSKRSEEESRERERERKAARASLLFLQEGIRKVDVHIGSVFPI